MAYFTKSDVRSAAKKEVSKSRYYSAESYLDSVNKSFSSYERFDVFLSHSINDAELVLGVKALLELEGLTVYVDWAVDSSSSRENVSPETADMLRTRMKQSSSLIYIATNNAQNSKWMPWELGYFDGLSSGAVSVMPILENSYSIFSGQEYLGLYPTVQEGIYSNGRKDIFVKKKHSWKNIRDFGRNSNTWRAYA